MLDPYGVNEFGKYDIIAEIGRGAFGIVYNAKDLVLGRHVAIKVLHPALLVDLEFIERFKHEARVAALLDHPNVVPVYDFGQEAGRYFLVMAYMPGGSLSSLIKNVGALPTDRVVKISKEIGAGLAYAHQRNVIHRDLKPSNILFDDKGIARVSDMGFAKIRQGGSVASMTASGQLVGTPAYMAPEIWKGQSASEASDVYSLGLITVEMFSGRPLFDGESTPEIMLKHFQPRQIPDEIPSELKPVIEKALAEKPEERFLSIPEFIGQLEHPNLEIVPNDSFVEAALSWELEHFPDPDLVPKKDASFLNEMIGKNETTAGKKASLKWLIPAVSVLLFILVGLIFMLVRSSRGRQAVENAKQKLTKDALTTKNEALSVAITNTPTIPESTATSIPATATMLPNSTPAPSATAEPTLSPTPKPTLGIGSTLVREKDGMTMVYIPAGEFLMGYAPTRRETTEEYWIDETEVTIGMFKRCANEGVCDLSNVWRSGDDYKNYPVTNVTWHEANDYCQWAGGRLPTSFEWEKAGRGPNGNIYPWGNGAPGDDSYTRLVDSPSLLRSVKSYPRNVSVYGAHEMTGNAQEWVNDISPNVLSERMVRSVQLSMSIYVDVDYYEGCYLNLWSCNTIAYSHSLHRFHYRPETQRSPIRGFRCVYDVDID